MKRSMLRWLWDSCAWPPPSRSRRSANEQRRRRPLRRRRQLRLRLTLRHHSRVKGLQLGNAIGADKRVTRAEPTFAPGDTIYASSRRVGVAPSATLEARWTYGDAGQIVSSRAQPIAPTGPASSEFHISKPDGWPAGDYKVEISANGAVVGEPAIHRRGVRRKLRRRCRVLPRAGYGPNAPCVAQLLVEVVRHGVPASSSRSRCLRPAPRTSEKQLGPRLVAVFDPGAVLRPRSSRSRACTGCRSV